NVPFEFGNPPPNNVEPVTYVLRIWTVVGSDEDNTPVNFKFTVSPNVRAMIENRDAPDEQPVKVIETN
ncbi:MAG: hypothetical protein IH968_06720, partial [Gemmatimonadetes bacterium]|nr:hypothetical protein [Gemmatimonadota bacterium]